MKEKKQKKLPAEGFPCFGPRINHPSDHSLNSQITFSSDDIKPQRNRADSAWFGSIFLGECSCKIYKMTQKANFAELLITKIRK